MTDMQRPTIGPDGGGGPTDAELAAAVPRQGGKEFRIGIFVMVGLISMVLVLFLLTDPATLRGRYMVVTELTDAGGVRRGDPVQMRGVNIGRVHDFEMTADGRVAVTLEIEGAWGIPEGSRAVLAESGLFGGRTMAVIPGQSPTTVREWDTLPGSDRGGGLMDTAGRLGVEAEVVLGRLAALLDSSTMASVQGSATQVEGLTRELRSLLAAQRDDLIRLTENLGGAAEALDQTATDAGPRVASAAARADTMLARLDDTRDRLDVVLGSLDTVLARMERGEGTLGKLSRDAALYDHLAAAASSLDSLLVDVRRNPGRYINLRLF
jgi:phospholipid/cholesterol/gamma-HCH transport system substrate-binding protein